MFEAVLTLCLSLAEGPCRDQLLPGYESQDMAECTAALMANPPQASMFSAMGDVSAPRCEKAGAPLPVTEVAPGVFVHMGAIAEPNRDNRGDVSNAGFIIGEKSVAVIDSGSARWLGEGLWRAIRARTNLPVSHVILTHMHPDHVLGATAFDGSGARVMSHQALPRALADRQVNYLESYARLIGPAAFLGSAVPKPDVEVTGSTEIDLGGRVLELRAWPVAHTGNDLTVLDRASSTLFAGDLIFHRHVPALDGRLLGWQAVLEEMAQLPVARVVPGHGGPILTWTAGAEPVQQYLEVLARETRAAISAGQRLGEAAEQIGAGEAERWELFDAYNPRNATVAFTELEWE